MCQVQVQTAKCCPVINGLISQPVTLTHALAIIHSLHGPVQILLPVIFVIAIQMMFRSLQTCQNINKKLTFGHIENELSQSTMHMLNAHVLSAGLDSGQPRRKMATDRQFYTIVTTVLVIIANVRGLRRARTV